MSKCLLRLRSRWFLAAGAALATCIAASAAFAQGNWTALAPVIGSTGDPTPVEGMAVGRVAQTIIGAYGYAPSDPASENTLTNLTRLYDMSTNTWHLGANAPEPKRKELTYGETTFDGMFYAVGGVDAFATALNNLERYDPVNNTWTTLSPMPTARSGAAGAFLGNELSPGGNLYVIGGRTTAGGPCSGAAMNTVERYDTVTDTWTAAASLPSARSDLAAVAYGGKIYVFGGCDLATVFNDVDVYDPNTDTWTALAPMPTARASLVADVVGNLIFAIGGIHDAFGAPLSINEVYNVAPNQWVKSGAPDPVARGEAGVVANKGKIFVLGGGPYGISKSDNDVFNPVPISFFTH